MEQAGMGGALHLEANVCLATGFEINLCYYTNGRGVRARLGGSGGRLGGRN
jgi:hypothetical protein